MAEAFKNRKNAKKFIKAMNLLKEICIDGEDMDTLVEELGFDEYLTGSLVHKTSQRDLLRILADRQHPIMRRFHLIESEINYMCELLDSDFHKTYIPEDILTAKLGGEQITLLSLMGNVLYMCDPHCSEVDSWETREEQEHGEYIVVLHEPCVAKRIVEVTATSQADAEMIAKARSGNIDVEEYYFENDSVDRIQTKSVEKKCGWTTSGVTKRYRWR